MPVELVYMEPEEEGYYDMWQAVEDNMYVRLDIEYFELGYREDVEGR